MNILLRSIPFVVVIGLNVLAQASRYKVNMLMPYIVIGASVLVVNLLFTLFLKRQDYFVTTISAVALTGLGAVFILPDIGQFYVEHIIEGLYLGMFLMAVIPLVTGIKPFCFSISARQYPQVIVDSKSFLKLNNLMSAVWAFLFILGIIFTTIHYSDDDAIQTIISTLVPLFILVTAGIPINKYLPDYLQQNVTAEPIIFSSLAQAYEAMPYGLNRDLAKGLNCVIQFELTGNEAGTAHLTIKNQKCECKQGTHPNPDTTIKADSGLWLDIINNKISGDKAYMNKRYEVEGDATVLLNFSDLFKPKNMQDVARYVPRKMTYAYKSFAPGKIKNIVVFDGGPRSRKFSKTTLMVDNFVAGAKNAGATVDYCKLSENKIHHCVGCYSCWTKTPGVCIYKDDMTELRRKYREADLVIFASPLYIFNVTGILKNFMDRLLPVMKPYMLLDKKGYIKHPDRFPEKGEQGFVVFSACGFPDIKHNFDGLQAMFRLWDSHSEHTHLMGEFYMPASEIIVQPVYENRRKTIADVCYKAGKDVVHKGKIDKEHMQSVSFPGVTRTRFQRQADCFWETLDGKAGYMKEVPFIKSSHSM